MLARVLVDDRRSVARRVASPTSTVPGSAADWIREAVLTRSPATMPCPSAPSVTAASPVSTPARARSSGSSSSPSADRRDQIERGPHGALGVVLVRHRRPPDRHHRVADELLHRAAVEPDQPLAGLEVAGEELAHVLGVARLGARREADEVGEEDRDEPPLGDRRGGRGAGAGRRGVERRPALDAEARPGRHRAGRPGTRAPPGAAVQAELGPGAILGAAARAGHAPDLGAGTNARRALEPRRRLEPLEDLARLGQERRRVRRDPAP